MSASELTQENHVRRLAATHGYRVEVSRQPHQRDNAGQFNWSRAIATWSCWGSGSMPSLDDIEAYLKKEDH